MKEWNYYISGILKGKFHFEGNGILVSRRKVEKNKFDSFTEFEKSLKSEMKITLPLEYISRHLNDEVPKNTWQSEDKYFIEKDKKLWIQIGYVMNPMDFITDEKNQIICYMIHNGYFSEYLVLNGYEDYTPLSDWKGIEEESDSISILKNVMIEMRDGIKLSTDIYLPGNLKNEKTEAILIRTPYGKRRVSYREMLYAFRGYAVVIQDVRGREDSEGEFIGMYHEKDDGSDTMDWIAAQSWSNGRIGTIGGSYGGYVQWATASSGNKHLMTIISQVTSGSPFSDIERRNGAYHMGIMDWNMMMAGKRVDWESHDINWKNIDYTVPLKNVPEKLGKKVLFWDEYMKHECFDYFWKNMTFNQYSDNHNLPCLYLTGWHDGDILGTMEAWEMNKGKKNQRLIIGPWIHNFNSLRKVIDVDLGENAILYNLDLLYFKWFEKFLKGKDIELKTEGVDYYAEYRNKWFKDLSFPPQNTEDVEFFIAETSGEKKLVKGQNRHSFEFEYIYNPKDPAPQLKDKTTGKINIPIDYSEVEARKDVLSFTTEKFCKARILVGKPTVRLYAASSAVDTDWVVRLTKVDKEGKSRRIADGIVRAKFYDSYEKVNLLTPGKPYCYDISMQYCAVEICKGEALRLEITSSQFGEIFPNTNTGNDAADEREFVIAQQKIFSGNHMNSLLKVSFLRERNGEE